MQTVSWTIPRNKKCILLKCRCDKRDSEGNSCTRYDTRYAFKKRPTAKNGEKSELWNLDDMLALAHTRSAWLRCRALIGTYVRALLPRAGLTALCRAVNAQRHHV